MKRKIGSKPLGGDAEGQKKWKPLIKGFQVVVTVGLEPTVALRLVD